VNLQDHIPCLDTRSPEGRSLESRKILGMRVHATTYDDAVQRIAAWASQCESRYVCEAPVHMVMESYDSPQYQNVINGADLVTPGGMPIVWMMRLLGIPRQARVYGPAMTLKVCEYAAQHELKIGLYGGSEENMARLVPELLRRYPQLQIVYAYAPPFRKMTAEEDVLVRENIAASGAQILFVGLGCPKQERWMAEHRPGVRAVMLGVGAAFDFISGEKAQAPLWMQSIGTEWLFRLCTEPRRLWFRYFWHNPRFIVLALGQLCGVRSGRNLAGLDNVV
jgi:N-acetylglucosaminyldiphosphoundecaprenol N-acetyl-beta-D-mannosaminyltransferase